MTQESPSVLTTQARFPKRRFVQILKFCIAAGIFSLVIERTDSRRLWECLKTAEWKTALVAGLLLFSTIPLAGWRWQQLLSANGINVPFRSLLFTSHIGQLFTLFLPGPVGDDAIRMLYISKLVPDRFSTALSSVFLDRLLGLMGILFLAAACIPTHWDTLFSSDSFTIKMLSGGFLGIAVLAFLCLVPALTLGSNRMKQLTSQGSHLFPGERIPSAIRALGDTFCESRKAIIPVLSAAAVTQFLVCGAFYFAGQSVHVDVPFSIWLGFVPIILGSNAVPITVAGIGVRDYLLVLFLGTLAGVSSEEAIATSLIVLGLSVALGISGGIPYLLFSPSARK